MNGNVGIDRLGQLAYALEEPVTVRFGPQTDENSPPAWAEGLEDRIAKAVVTQLADARVLREMIDETGETARRPVESRQRSKRTGDQSDGHAHGAAPNLSPPSVPRQRRKRGTR